MTSSISSVGSSGLLSRYLDSTSNADLNAKTIFKKLSIDVGSDGKTISKDQLDSYISKIESGKVAVTNEEKDGLLEIQKNWDTISKGSESISASNVSSFGNVLKSMDSEDAEDTSMSDLKELHDSIQTQIKDYIVNSAFTSLSSSNEKTSGLSSLLNTLLSGTTDENDDANADLIDNLTNLIAKFKESSSTMEVEA